MSFATISEDEQEQPAVEGESPEQCAEHNLDELSDSTWWSRPGGGREVLQVAMPLVVSSLSWTVMTFVDRMMLKHWSGEAMTAAFIGSTAWFSLLCLPLGISAYTSTFVAQYHGSSQPKRIGPSVWQGTWLAIITSPLTLACIFIAPWLFSLAGHEPEIAALEIDYFVMLCYGSPALLIGQSLSSFYSGRGKTVVVMVVDAFFAIVNLLLDYLLIFGHFGFPAMGIEGAGLATVISLWLKAITYATLFLLRSNQAGFATNQYALDTKLFRRMLYYGWPSGLQFLLDVVGFTTFIILVGRLGEVEGEATTMAFSISALAFMPVNGIAMAAGILVGQHLGENRDNLAARATWTSLHVSLGYMGLLSILYLFAPELFLYGFRTDTPSQRDPLVFATAVMLLKFVALYNLLDACLMIFASAIKGAGDTQFVLKVSIVMASLLALLSWLAVHVFNLGLYGCWTLITLWICGLGVIFLLRFLQGSWRSMRVIEMPSADQ